MILTTHNPGAGLFSHINFLVTVLEARGDTDFHVDWTEGMVYCEPGAGNLFEQLFEQLSPAKEGAEVISHWPHMRYTGTSAPALYAGKSEWRWKLNECWKQLKVLPGIGAEVERFSEGWEADMIALHVRNYRIGIECPGGDSPRLVDYAEVLERVTGRVFLATDNEEAVAFFRRRFGDRIVVRDIPRASTMEVEYHQTAPQSVHDARNVLIDALLMARCGHLVHSVSNIATAVLYMNPQMRHTFVCGGRAMCSESLGDPDDRAILKETVSNQ
jgi:hypothetical protein